MGHFTAHPKNETTWVNLMPEVILVALVVLIVAVTRHPRTDASWPQVYPLGSTSASQNGLSLPNPQLTPGDVLTADTKTICVPGFSTVDRVPQALKKQVYAEYGILKHQPHQYEVDRLISLGLGGSNAPGNLWPQPNTSPLNAHHKNRLENKLHTMVCSGQLPIGVAQQAIAHNWVAAYQKYVGPTR